MCTLCAPANTCPPLSLGEVVSKLFAPCHHQTLPTFPPACRAGFYHKSDDILAHTPISGGESRVLLTRGKTTRPHPLWRRLSSLSTSTVTTGPAGTVVTAPRMESISLNAQASHRARMIPVTPRSLVDFVSVEIRSSRTSVENPVSP